MAVCLACSMCQDCMHTEMAMLPGQRLLISSGYTGRAQDMRSVAVQRVHAEASALSLPCQ